MSHKTKLPDGGFVEILYSLWDGDKQITAWRRSKHETRAALVRSGHARNKMFAIKAQQFITPPREPASV